MASTRLATATTASDQRTEIFREAVTMVLYVSVIEIAELAALPEGHFANGRATGAVGGKLLALVWGTAVGLVLAHWFAFQFAAPLLRGERPTRRAAVIGLAQVGGAIFVAAVSSCPVLFLSDVRAQELTGDVPAIIIGVVAYVIARIAGRPRVAAVLYGVTALALGVLVALVKSILVAH
ncbi:MAG TPA: hypothetical protein VKI01_15370 [Acidimicrobiia bacterium]|nr:hypothetical protein [Acidimicrobiia bacterium]